MLWGAVLTAFVGVSGLMHRMASDACLPSFLAHENRRGSYPYIVAVFFLLCSSILILTKGNLLSLAGVYTIAFLGVMSSFALGNLILKRNRAELKRTYRAPVFFALFAFASTMVGVLGNIYLDPKNFIYFCTYFIPSFLIVLAVIYEDVVLSSLLRTTGRIPVLHRYLQYTFNDLIQGRFVVMIHNTHRLSKILDYIYRNETGRNVTLVVCRDKDDSKFQELRETLPHLRKAGVYPKLNLSLVYSDRTFGPDTVEEISRNFKIRKNRILIGSIHNHHPYSYDQFGGARIIF